MTKNMHPGVQKGCHWEVHGDRGTFGWPMRPVSCSDPFDKRP
jgi:hypothetical protein